MATLLQALVFAFTLTWDCSSNIDGYKIYNGTESGKFGEPVVISDPNTCTYTPPDDLQSKKLFWAATTFKGSDESSVKYEIFVTPKPQAPIGFRVDD